MQGPDIGEVARRRALQRDVAVRAANLRPDPAPVEGRERILQTYPELADDQLGLALLLRVLVLGEVLVVQPASEIRDVPSIAALDDLRRSGTAERLLVEGIGDHLPDCFRHAPVVEDLLAVAVEK